MSEERVHEWEYKKPKYDSDMWVFRCKTCPPDAIKTMTFREAEVKLNAAERLKKTAALVTELETGCFQDVDTLEVK